MGVCAGARVVTNVCLRVAALVAWLSLASQGLAQDSLGVRLEYWVRVEQPESEVVRLEARWSGLEPERERLDLHMVEHYSYSRLQAPRLVGEAKAETAGGESLALVRRGPYRWSLEKGAASAIVLRWSVRLDHRRQSEVAPGALYDLPYLAADHGLLVPAALLVLPEVQAVEESSIWIELPEGWQVLAPWPQDERGAFRPRGERDLVSNLVAIGDWSRTQIQQEQTEIVLAFAPGQADLQRAVVPLIRPVLALELELFDDEPFERYLLLFGRPDIPGLAGSPKTSSMALSAQFKAPGTAVLGELVHLLAHEFFHTWAGAHFDAPDELRFVNEGFTEFFALLVMTWTGHASWEKLGEELGHALSRWEANCAARPLSLIEAGGEAFFRNIEAKNAVYAGGTTLAALFDLWIRKERPGSSLIDLLRALHNNPRWQVGGARPDMAELEHQLASFVGVERARELVALARAPRTPDLVALFSEAGVLVERRQELASLNFRAQLEQTTLVGLDPVDLPYRVGLRAGDALLWVNGQTVTDAEGILRAWREVREERIEVRYRRNGSEHELKVPHPLVERYVLDGRAFYPLASAVGPR